MFLSVQSSAWSATDVAVLDFELNDLTLRPNGPDELARTASVRPLLEEALGAAKDIRIVTIDASSQHAADASVGYLFAHSNVAARLGASAGADWVLVGRVHKPSFLFAYLMVRMIDTSTGKVAEDLLVEVKGQQELVTAKGVERLAIKILRRLAAESPTSERRRFDG